MMAHLPKFLKNKLTFAKTSGIVTGDRKTNWPIADQRVPSNHPRRICECSAQFPLVFKVIESWVNVNSNGRIYTIFQERTR